MKGQKLDKKFTRRAWAEMSRLLDREMPVAAPPRKRRIAGWWWLLAGLSLGAGMAALWFSSLEEPQPLTPVERPVAQTQNQEQHEISAAVTGNSKVIEPVATAEETPALPAPTAATAAPAEVPPVANHFVPPGKSALTDAGNSRPMAAAAPPATTNDTKAAARPPSPISGLASLPLALLTEPQPGLQLPVGEQPGGKHQPELLAYASALASPVFGSNGLAAGVLASFRLKNPRLSLEAGLGYTYIRQPLSILASGEAASGSNPTGGQEQEVLYGFEDLTDKATRFESNYLLATQDLGLHYAEVPVQLAFRASPKWQFYAGVSLLILLESSPDFTGGGLLDFSGQNFDMASGGLYNQGISSNTLLVPLSKIDVQAIAGARYRLNRRWSAGLQYQTGTVDVVKSNGAADYHRLLRLSLFHHFSK